MFRNNTMEIRFSVLFTFDFTNSKKKYNWMNYYVKQALKFKS